MISTTACLAIAWRASWRDYGASWRAQATPKQERRAMFRVSAQIRNPDRPLSGKLA